MAVNATDLIVITYAVCPSFRASLSVGLGNNSPISNSNRSTSLQMIRAEHGITDSDTNGMAAIETLRTS